MKLMQIKILYIIEANKIDENKTKIKKKKI